MFEYEKHTFSGLLIQGKLREAVEYLSQFPQKQRLMRRYYSIFEDGNRLKRSDNTLINAIDATYQEYYRMVFWQQIGREQAAASLCAALCELLHLQVACNESDALEKVEEAVGATVTNEGFSFLGGTTSGYFGPYIWRSTESVQYSIALPQNNRKLTVCMMDGFVSRSWLDFLSFGKIGTGGWAGNDGQLYCVRSAYATKMDKPAFRISYLMHEAQHALDKELAPDMSPLHLEYRAKLVELIAYPRITKFRSFLAEASDTDEANFHAFASYQIVSGLSRRMFDSQYESDFNKWRGKLQLI
jgi:hypothetical protein